MTGERGAMGMSRRLWSAVAGILMTAALVIWFARPVFHPVFFGLYRSPAVLEGLVLMVLAGLGLRYTGVPSRLRGRSLGETDLGQVAVSLLLLAAVFLLLGAAFLGSAFSQVHVSENLEVRDVQELPEVSAESPRILPLSVAEQYASNSLQFPRYQAGASDVAVRDGVPQWSFVLVPDGFVNFFRLKGLGAVFVNMSTASKDVAVVEDRLELGPGMGVTDNYLWALEKERYWVEYGDPFAVESGGRVYLAVPFTEYSHHFRFPLVYTAPRWGGVALVSPDGETEFLSPEEARRNEVLRGQKLFPFALARLYVESFRYQHGVVNKLFLHEDELEVAPLPGENNDQPFTLLTREGVKYVVAAEPYGNAQGIYQIWVVDGRTGSVERLRLSMQEALLGPGKASQYVRKANPVVDWDRMNPSEPIPAVVNGRLFWEVRVVPAESSGVAYVAFVDAETGDVAEARTDAEVRRFLATGDTGPGPAPVSQGRGNVSMVIEVYENGSVVERVDVTEGQRVEIRGRGR